MIFSSSKSRGSKTLRYSGADKRISDLLRVLSLDKVSSPDINKLDRIVRELEKFGNLISFSSPLCTGFKIEDGRIATIYDLYTKYSFHQPVSRLRPKLYCSNKILFDKGNDRLERMNSLSSEYSTEFYAVNERGDLNTISVDQATRVVFDRKLEEDEIKEISKFLRKEFGYVFSCREGIIGNFIELNGLILQLHGSNLEW